MKTWLYEYEFEGETYSLTIEGETAGHADERLHAISQAVLVGELSERIPVKTGARPILVASAEKKE